MERDLNSNGLFDANEVFEYHADGLGSIVALTDSTGTVVRSYRYDTFGNLLAETGTLAQPYGFTGREFDQESGLYYYRARYYDPRVGRFLQEDPVNLAALQLPQLVTQDLLHKLTPAVETLLFNPLRQHGYAYVENNPLQYSDPAGQQSTALVLLFVAATVGAILTVEFVKLLVEHVTQDIPLHLITEELREVKPIFEERNRELDQLDRELREQKNQCPVPGR